MFFLAHPGLSGSSPEPKGNFWELVLTFHPGIRLLQPLETEGRCHQDIYDIPWYQILLLGWETYKYYGETVELPDPRPTQPKKKSVTCGLWATIFPQQIVFFVRQDWVYMPLGSRLTRSLTQSNSPPTPYSYCSYCIHLVGNIGTV